MRLVFAFAAWSGIALFPVLAQEGIKPAPVLEIFREAIKEGRSAAHEKVESDYAAAFRKVNFPAHYVGLSAISGPSEAWFLQPTPSFATAEEWSKATDKEPLKSTIAILDARDGELRANSRAIWAVYRPDLSYRPEKFQPGKVRYVGVNTFRVRLGHDEDFGAGAKSYLDAHDKANIDLCILGYQVTAGDPAGTYLFFSMMDSMKVLDGGRERMTKVMDAMGADAYSRFMKSSGDMITSIEETIFEVKPGMSYVSQATIDADPAFWRPKAASAPRPAATPAAEKKGEQ